MASQISLVEKEKSNIIYMKLILLWAELILSIELEYKWL